MSVYRLLTLLILLGGAMILPTQVKSEGWLPLQTSELISQHPSKTLAGTMSWLSTPTQITTHRQLTLSWQPFVEATYHELWHNGTARQVRENNLDLYFTEPGKHQFKVRACNGVQCSQFSETLTLDIVRRFDFDFGTNNEVLIENQSGQIRIAPLTDAPTDTVMASLDGQTWHPLTLVNGQYVFSIEAKPAGAYTLHLKVNQERIEPVDFRVYAQPLHAPQGIAIGLPDTLDFHQQQAVEVDSQQTLVLHWQASDDVAPPLVGYYKLFINGERDGTIYRSLTHLNRKYGEGAYHTELHHLGTGAHQITIQGCNKLTGTEYCGPLSQAVYAFVGVPPTPYVRPAKVVDDFHVSAGVLHPRPTDILNVQTGEEVIFHWQPSDEVVAAPNGYYLLELNDQWLGSIYGVVSFLRRQYNDGNFHVRAKITQTGLLNATVRACNRVAPGMDRSLSCGPKSSVARIHSVPAKPDYQLKFSHVNNGVITREHPLKLEASTLSSPYIDSLKVKVNQQEWRTVSGSQHYHYDFGILEPGTYDITVKVNDYFTETFNIEVVNSINTIRVEQLSVNKTNIGYGDEVLISWQKPAQFNEPVLYRIAIEKPSAKAGEPTERFIWQNGVTETSIRRGPIFRRGTTFVEVSPCLSNGQCGIPSRVHYRLQGNTLPTPNFTLLPDEVARFSAPQFNWHMPDNFSEDVSATFFVRSPGSTTLNQYVEDAPLTQTGEYYFYIEICDNKHPEICNDKQLTELAVNVVEATLEVTLTDDILTWRKLQTAQSYQLQSTLCIKDCLHAGNYQWQTEAELGADTTTYQLVTSQNRAYRIRACFFTGQCSNWVYIAPTLIKLKAPELRVNN
ncbi:hypothetical protein CWC22_005965 [Pseudoalteromonas rubra]|uniref:Uncharacterized protein n=1 Tax=Pseudoalteromonas rubra TaxID=43658 RepID=A0A5S3URA2_9GAMM|nr:hypothetical protein [Pseudoalteromonas rubra]QPB82561.1 hypothetical protein CWC22_005965 [Pseudoalteromonas rubra]